MTVTSARPAAAIRQTPRQTAAAVAGPEVAALLQLLESLQPDEWLLDTDCTGWRVRDIVAHLVGAGEDSIRIRTLLRHVARSRRRHRDLSFLDGLNETQVDDRRDLPVPQLLADARAVLPRAVRARARALPIRSIPVPMGEPLGMATPAYLNDVIYVRDLWLHRVDIARATGRELERHDHEAEIVRQVVRDLARGWSGPAVDLHVPGPASGVYRVGAGATAAEVAVDDDVEWLRLLSGRSARVPLNAVSGEPPLEQLAAARVAF